MDSVVSRFTADHGLPAYYGDIATAYFLPVIHALSERAKGKGDDCPLMVSLVGCQGSGKTTLTELMTLLWQNEGLKVTRFSLDDYYLTRQERVILGDDVHHLLATRGVPGTHDVAALGASLSALKQGLPTEIYQFDKSSDDRASQDCFTQVKEVQDIVLVEGWCWGARAQSEDSLSTPVNSLEASEDKSLSWRRYVNDSLRTHYEPLYELMDVWLMLKAPSFDCVYQWRLQQEQALIDRLKSKGQSLNKTMNASEIERFILFFQRVTEYLLASMPAKADYVWELGSDRQVISLNDNARIGEAISAQSL